MDIKVIMMLEQAAIGALPIASNFKSLYTPLNFLRAHVGGICGKASR